MSIGVRLVMLNGYTGTLIGSSKVAWDHIRPNSMYKSSAVAEMGDRLATIGMGRKWGGAAVWAGSQSNTMWPGPRPTSLPSGILIHPTVWPQLYQCHAPPRRNTLTDYFYP